MVTGTNSERERTVSVSIDLTPAAKLALGFKTENTNGKVRIRIIANSAQRGKAALK